MNKYEIEVKAIGYDTTKLVVLAENLVEAKKSKAQAISAWLLHNDVDSSVRDLAFVRICRT